MQLADLWVKKLTHLIEESKHVPMWGKVPSFPWEGFTQVFKETFHFEEVHFSAKSADWKEYENILDGLSDHPIVVSLVLSPLASSFFFAVSKDDVAKLCSLLISTEQKWNFSDPEYQKGFFKYCFLNVISSFDSLKTYQDLSVKLNSLSPPKESAYCVDVISEVEGQKIIGRAIFPKSFHSMATAHFMSKPLSLEHVDDSLLLPVSLEAGKVHLSPEEISSIDVGDFVVLDECNYQPATKKGLFQLCLDAKSLFVVQEKNGGVHILDYALTETIPSEEEFMMEDYPEGEEDLGTEEAVSHIIATKDVSLSVRVEIGRAKMPLKKLLSLKPGNTLDLGISFPEKVSLTVENQIIAKGELIQLGDMIGVKISEISH